MTIIRHSRRHDVCCPNTRITQTFFAYRLLILFQLILVFLVLNSMFTPAAYRSNYYLYPWGDLIKRVVSGEPWVDNPFFPRKAICDMGEGSSCKCTQLHYRMQSEFQLTERETIPLLSGYNPAPVSAVCSQSHLLWVQALPRELDETAEISLSIGSK